MEYPRLVYKSASEHVAVADESERAERLASGWFDSVPEAAAGRHDEPVVPPATALETPLEPEVPAPVVGAVDSLATSSAPDPFDRDGDGKPGGSLPQSERDDPVTRPELEQKARELGIKFDGRTTDKSLTDKIERALKA